MGQIERSPGGGGGRLSPGERQQERLLLVAGLLSLGGPLAAAYAFYVGQSVVLLADLLRSGAESLGLVLSWAAYHVSRRYRGPDRKQRARRVDVGVGLLVAGVMWLSAVIITVSAVRELIDPQPVGRILAGVVVALGGAAYNGWFWWRYLGIARRSGSVLFDAQWRIYRAKAVVNAAVLLTLVAGWAMRPHLLADSVDGIGSLVVAAFLVASGLGTVRKAKGARKS